MDQEVADRRTMDRRTVELKHTQRKRKMQAAGESSRRVLRIVWSRSLTGAVAPTHKTRFVLLFSFIVHRFASRMINSFIFKVLRVIFEN